MSEMKNYTVIGSAKITIIEEISALSEDEAITIFLDQYVDSKTPKLCEDCEKQIEVDDLDESSVYIEEPF